jgi:hypothetical protein
MRWQQIVILSFVTVLSLVRLLMSTGYLVMRLLGG